MSYTVITGASSGIGYEAAKAFASRGKNLILTARRVDRLEKLRAEILQANHDLSVVIIPADLSVPENVHEFYASLEDYELETFINNAGFGNYSSVAEQNLAKIENMISLDVEAVVILSSLFVRDYANVSGTQLINISSAGGYTIVPNAVTYCAAKFFVSTFTEGLARELRESGAKMRAKILAPAATETEFGKKASDISEYDYTKAFKNFHSAEQMANFLLRLYDSEETLGLVDRENFTFELRRSVFNYAGA